MAASVLWWFGVSMFYFRTPFNLFHAGVVVLSPDLQPLVTALWVVLMTNAVNLIDGLDGLAAGIVAIAGAALFLFADRLFKAGYLDGHNIAPLVAMANDQQLGWTAGRCDAALATLALGLGNYAAATGGTADGWQDDIALNVFAAADAVEAHVRRPCGSRGGSNGLRPAAGRRSECQHEHRREPRD